MVAEVSVIIEVSVAAVSVLMFSSRWQPTSMTTQSRVMRVRTSDFFIEQLSLVTESSICVMEIQVRFPSGCPAHLISHFFWETIPRIRKVRGTSMQGCRGSGGRYY